MPAATRSTTTPRQPHRYLPPHLAAAIAGAKQRTGMSWRELGRQCGVSHSFLIQLAHGKRVPSTRTVDAITDVLVLDPHVVTGLRAIASPMRSRRT